MARHSTLILLSGAALVMAIGYAGGLRYGESFAAAKRVEVATAITEVGGDPVRARLVNALGSPTRHPVLEDGSTLDEATRARVARAVAQVRGIGGVFWADGTFTARADAPQFTPLHCQEDVQVLLRSRTLRFETGSSSLVPGSQILLDEVAEALRPCLGSIIAVSGHTDSSGPEPGNLELSRERAVAVREALIRRGIPREGLQARGYGSRVPVPGLAPSDPANRRIEFTVVATEPLVPTPVDTPGAR